MPDNDSLENNQKKLSEGNPGGFFPGGRGLTELPAEIIEEQKSILFSSKKVIAERFEIIEELGFGAAGAVYKVRDVLLNGQLTALKILLPSLVKSKELRERFISEAQNARTLRHDGIAAIYDIGEDKKEDILFLVTELLEGKDLVNYLNSKDGKLEFTDACDIILQICDVMTYAHNKGFIHGGIKPRNIVILPDRKVKLLDFGLSMLLNRRGQNRFGAGFDWYMSPEQAMGKDVDARTDIFAVGVVFYHMLAVQQPGSDFRWPSGIEDIIKKCLMPWPEDRYDSIASLSKEIERVRSGFVNTTRENDKEKEIVKPGEQAGEPEAENTVPVDKHDADSDPKPPPTHPSEGKGGGKKSGKPLALAFIIIIVLILAGVFVYYSIKATHRSDIVLVPQENNIRVPHEINEKAAVTLPNLTIATRGKTDIASLMVKAEEQSRALKHTSPLRDNALLTLREILKADPENSKAKKMVEDIRDIYMIQGEKAFNDKSYFIAKTFFEKALYVYPGFPPALNKLSESKAFLSEQAVHKPSETWKTLKVGAGNDIISLLAKADKQFKAKKYISPLSDNAFITLKEVLKIDPENSKAKKKIEDIRDIYMAQGEEAFKDSSYVIAKTYFEMALYVYPDFPPAQKKIAESDALSSERTGRTP